ncbi:LCP family protein [Floccifex sp.]|uniref:LCP family protein n=1 Tax=Floccifex sp. TaxID=2815810 RepID=UPI0029FF4512|nr:LCP family protein [Floccifex sp.]MDD7281407.1 LCP family protein [Erysipelotrichaceae bacterium]MDY2958440.1 LCP family protein [Floccifex sp.]
MKRRQGIFVFILTISLFYLIYNTVKLNLIPYIYIIALVILYIILIGFTIGFDIKGHKTIALVMCICLSVSCLGFGSYADKTMETLSKISNISKQKKKPIYIYTLKESSIESKEDLKKKSIGYLIVDEKQSMECIDSLDFKVDTVAYSSSENLMNNLNEGLIDSICIDKVYLDIISDYYPDFEETTKLVYTYTIYTEETTSTISDVDVINEPFTVLISGIDTRTGTFDDSDARSDVNLVASINPKTHQIFLLSIPRDYYVETVCDVSDGCANGEMDKLTHTGWHGISTTEKTIENLLDIEINYNVLVNFQTVVTLVDLLDGVDVYSDYDVELSGSYHACSVEQGMNHLNGECALAFARERYAYVDGDRQRGKNQMEIIRAIIEKCLSTSLLNNFSDILNIMSDLFQTNMSMNQIMGFVKQQLEDGSQWMIYQYSLNGESGTDYAYELHDYAYVMYPDETTIDNAKKDIEAIYNGQEVPYVN